MSCVLLDFGFNLGGLGEPLRSAGDLGGTSGRCSGASLTAVSTFSAGFVVTPGLRMGDKGLPNVLGASGLVKKAGARRVFGLCSGGATGAGPSMQDIRALPKGSALQFVPGALLDRSWPNASAVALFRAGRPGIVATCCQLDSV
jgi:hypothetical protein